jgi:hypothetical protein
MATKCPACGDGGGTFRQTVNGVVHYDHVCGQAAIMGRTNTDGISACARCGAVGQHDNGYCHSCQWWA